MNIFSASTINSSLICYDGISKNGSERLREWLGYNGYNGGSRLQDVKARRHFFQLATGHDSIQQEWFQPLVDDREDIPEPYTLSANLETVNTPLEADNNNRTEEILKHDSEDEFDIPTTNRQIESSPYLPLQQRIATVAMRSPKQTPPANHPATLRVHVVATSGGLVVVAPPVTKCLHLHIKSTLQVVSSSVSGTAQLTLFSLDKEPELTVSTLDDADVLFAEIL
ncbi:hypothetical protein C0Q70_08403 [Pomacea canaliculata]|uniref:Uncharacterized protein n=1 Tax=Pomacea canaliculata TaxID=400727 RepID=A0A2T7PHQ7_POMCA|nr:hypothetical protein C0Q70_08403 [Pomacea canaliculata]